MTRHILKSPLPQFTLRQLLLFVLVVALFCAAYVWAGLWGTIVSVCVASLVGLIAAFVKGNRAVRAAAVAFAISLGILALDRLTLFLGSGRSPQALTFVIVALDDGRPVPQSRVRIREIETGRYESADPIPTGEKGVEGLSDARGQITLTYPFRSSVSGTLLRHHVKVVFGIEQCVQVSAAGYETELFPIETGILFVPKEAFPLPPMTLKLKRKASGP